MVVVYFMMLLTTWLLVLPIMLWNTLGLYGLLVSWGTFFLFLWIVGNDLGRLKDRRQEESAEVPKEERPSEPAVIRIPEGFSRERWQEVLDLY